MKIIETYNAYNMIKNSPYAVTFIDSNICKDYIISGLDVSIYGSVREPDFENEGGPRYNVQIRNMNDKGKTRHFDGLAARILFNAMVKKHNRQK